MPGSWSWSCKRLPVAWSQHKSEAVGRPIGQDHCARPTWSPDLAGKDCTTTAGLTAPSCVSFPGVCNANPNFYVPPPLPSADETVRHEHTQMRHTLKVPHGAKDNNIAVRCCPWHELATPLAIPHFLLSHIYPQALIAFKAALGGSSPMLAQWVAAIPSCSWLGVVCRSTDARVTSITLNNQGLTGALPTGALAGMPALKQLVLTNNSLSGPLPADISLLTSLQQLDLTNNTFSGALPAAWSTLTGLTSLQLTKNSITGGLTCCCKRSST